jgi:hypothetical protein
MAARVLLPVVAALNIANAVTAVLIIAGSAAGGVWLGKRLTGLLRRPGEPQPSLRESLKRNRAQTRKLLTPGERRFAYGYTLVSGLLPAVAIGLLVFGTSTTRAVGAGLLLFALVLMAVPISPFLRARVRRRERRASDRK